MTLPADHHWRCDCGGGHFLTIVWDPGETPRVDAHIEGYLAVEGDSHTPWRDRIKQAWRVLASGHSATRVGVILDAAKAREIAVVLSDFAVDATGGQSLADILAERGRRLLAEAYERADPAKVARMMAHVDEQAARIAPQLEEQRARRLRLSDLHTATEIHDRDMRNPEYRREYERDPTWDEAVAALDAATPVELVRSPREVTVEYRHEDGAITATSPEIGGFRATGRDFDEARQAVREALGRFLDPAVTVVEHGPEEAP